MTTYVALLRGINVGGKAKVDMPTLRSVIADLGCEDVASYINSGNVLFRDKRTARKLVPLAEAAIEERFGFAVRVLLRDLPAIQGLCGAIPEEWVNDSEQKTDVMFLHEEIDTPALLDSVAVNPDIERVLHTHGALVWNIGREHVTRGGGVKLIKTDLYQRMTVRNVNTVRKLRTLMEDLG